MFLASPRALPFVSTAPRRVLTVLVIAAVAAVAGVLWLSSNGALQSTVVNPSDVPAASTNIHPAMMAALALAQRAGRVIKDIQETGTIEGLPPELAKEPLTLADIASNEVLAEFSRPELPVISEEGVGSGQLPYIRHPSHLVTYIDPLDATQEFSEGLTKYVSIAISITKCGEPIGSVTHFPFTGATYTVLPMSTKRSKLRYASPVDALHDVRTTRPTMFVPAALENCVCKGQPAAKAPGVVARGVRARAMDPPSLSAPLRVIVTRSHFVNETRSSQTGLLSLRSVLERLQEAYPDMELIRAGGAGYKVAAVFDNTADLYIHDGPIRMWDVAAGVHLLRVAGLFVSDWTGARHSFCMSPDAYHYARTRPDLRPEKQETPPYDKRSFAVKGIVAARTEAVHAYVLSLIASD